MFIVSRSAARSYVFFILSFLSLSSVSPAQGRIGSYKSDTLIDRSVIITTTLDHRVRITPYGDHIIRIQTVRSGEEFFPDDHYEMVESHVWSGTLQRRDKGGSIQFASNGAVLTVHKDPLKFIINGTTEESLLFEESGGVQWNGDTVRLSLTSDPKEHFTGLGHGYYGRESSLDLRGKLVRRNYGTEHGQQAPLLVPFFLSSKGYGFFLNSTFPNVFDLNSAGKFEISLIGKGQMDYFVIIGPHFREIIDRYTQLTGRPRLLPKSAFGLALSDKGNDHTTSDPSDEAWWKRKISAHRAAGFPLDHIVNDNRWRAGGGQRCVSRFEWDTMRYPDPAEYAAWVKSHGLIVTLDLNRCISSHSEGWDQSFNIPHSDEIDFKDSAPDFTKKEVRDWFWNLFWKKSLDPKLGFPGDALWIDEFDEMGKASVAMVLGNGRTWGEMRNYWFFLIAKSLVQQGWDRSFGETKRPFVWVRGMTAGAQRYATLWSGDIKPSYADMKTQVRSMQLTGLSGFPFWGHDAGGFNNWEENHGPDDTMYRQWSMAFGSFTPFWKPHGIGASRWPLDRPAAVQKDAKLYAELRYRLMPYLYSAAHHASASGLPMARAMVIDHQNDERAWSHDLQFMWGSSILVAPNCSEGDPVNIWLPEGKWFDYWTDQRMNGGVEIEYQTPVGRLPLFVKAGSIIPAGQYAVSTAFIPQESLTVHIYPGDDGRFTLIEDDGISERYKTRNEIRRTEFSFRQRDTSLTIAGAVGSFLGARDERIYRIEFHGISKRTCAAVNGRILKEIQKKSGSGKSRSGILWDQRRNIVTVLLPQMSVRDTAVITLSAICP